MDILSDEKKSDALFDCMRRVVASVNFLTNNIGGGEDNGIDNFLALALGKGIASERISPERATELVDKFENFALSLAEEYRGAVLQLFDDLMAENGATDKSQALEVRADYERFLARIPATVNEAVGMTGPQIAKIVETIIEEILKRGKES